jgi:tetratricopeptide (TPR) repeat protein
LAGIYQKAGRFDDSVAECKQAIAISRYNPRYYADLADVYMDMRDYENAVASSEKSIILSPYAVEWYEFKSNTCLNAGLSSLQNGDIDAARKYLLLPLDVPSQIEIKMADLDEKMKRRWVDRPLLTVTPPVRLDVGTACCFLGQFAKAEENLSVALKDKNTQDKAALMLAVMRGKQGRAEEARDLLKQVQAVNPELRKSYDGLLKLPVIGQY